MCRVIFRAYVAACSHRWFTPVMVYHWICSATAIRYFFPHTRNILHGNNPEIATQKIFRLVSSGNVPMAISHTTRHASGSGFRERGKRYYQRAYRFYRPVEGTSSSKISSPTMATAANGTDRAPIPLVGLLALPNGLTMDNTYGAVLLGAFFSLMFAFLPFSYEGRSLTMPLECMACYFTRHTTTSASVPGTTSGSSLT